jgi:hypothetical protein
VPWPLRVGRAEAVPPQCRGAGNLGARAAGQDSRDEALLHGEPTGEEGIDARQQPLPATSANPPGQGVARHATGEQLRAVGDPPLASSEFGQCVRCVDGMHLTRVAAIGCPPAVVPTMADRASTCVHTTAPAPRP